MTSSLLDATYGRSLDTPKAKNATTMPVIEAKHRENMVPHRQSRQRRHGPFYANDSTGCRRRTRIARVYVCVQGVKNIVVIKNVRYRRKHASVLLPCGVRQRRTRAPPPAYFHS